MTRRFLSRTAALLAALPLAALAQTSPNDYPTSERVVYVQACMRDNPGPHYEMLNKCSCAIDRIAAEVPFDDFVSMSTASNANSIGGERGSYIRDSDGLQKQIRAYRALQAKAKKSCMFNVEPAVR